MEKLLFFIIYFNNVNSILIILNSLTYFIIIKSNISSLSFPISMIMYYTVSVKYCEIHQYYRMMIKICACLTCYAILLMILVLSLDRLTLGPSRSVCTRGQAPGLLPYCPQSRWHKGGLSKCQTPGSKVPRPSYRLDAV